MYQKVNVPKLRHTGSLHTVGLRSDGTVVATGYNEYSQCDTEQWTDITAVCVSGNRTLGLKKDGTVIITGCPQHPQAKMV